MNVVFLAEAFSSEPSFRHTTDAILALLEATPTFPRTLIGRVEFYRFYAPTNALNDAGPAEGSSSQHTTLLGTTVDAAGLLGLDLDALNRVTASSFLTNPADGLYDSLVGPDLGLARTVLAVLLPEPAGSKASRARAVRRGDHVAPGSGPQPQLTSAEHDFILAETGGNLHLLLMRQIGEALGLAPEWSVPESAPDGAGYDRPTPLHGATYHGPNLAYIPEDRSNPSYRRSLDALVAGDGAGLLGLTRVQASERVEPGIVSGRYIEMLYEGGGGFRRDFYRTAPDCIMRRRLPHEYTGAGFDPVALGHAQADLAFCPACAAHLEALLGVRASFQPISFDRQRNKFQQIWWGNAPRGQSFDSVFDSPRFHSVDARPSSAAPGGHHFVFDMALTDADGLVFTNIFNNRGGTTPALHRPIADELRFRDLRVRLVSPDGTRRTRGIDLSRAAADGTVETFYGTGGVLGQDNLWHHGFLYRAVVNVDDEVEVTVEQSVCFRGPSNDFDPTKAVVALKVYPELCFSYRSLDGVTSADAFHGCVWQDVRPTSDPMMHPEEGGHHHGGALEEPMSIYTSWFAEINPKENNFKILPRTRLSMSGLNLPNPFDSGLFLFVRHMWSSSPVAFYAGIFAYWMTQENAVPSPNPAANPPQGTPPVQTEMEVVAVRHIDQARRNRPVEAVYRWPGRDALPGDSSTDSSILVVREAREGQYDNVHNHGWMGVSRNPGSDSNLEMPRRMAPVCGQACIHLHVRWLFGADMQNVRNNGYSTSGRSAYWGWGDDPLTARPNSEACKPLVPPNQRVRIAVTNPDRDRVNAGNPATMGTVLPGTTLEHGVRIARALDPTHRGLWYDVDVEGHIAENQKHVILEQGWGYAADHATEENGYEVPSITWLRNTAYYFGYDDHTGRPESYLEDSFELVMMFVYDCWLFHLHDGLQIPYGDLRNSTTSDLSMERF